MHHLPPADPVAAVTHPDPWPYYASLREGPPLAWSETLKLWVASRADVIEAVLSAAHALRVRPAAEAVPRAIVGSPAGEVFGHLVRMNDGHAHDLHKPVLQRALANLDLGAAHASALRVGAEACTASPLNDALFAMPIRSVAHLLGFNEEALPDVTQWMRDFVACLSPLSTEAQLRDAGEAAAALMARFEAIVGRTPPRDAALLQAVRAGADRPASRALLSNLVGLLSQTCDATAGLLGNSLLALATHPGLEEAATSREGLQAIVRETARHDPSVHNTRRFAHQAITVAGTAIAPGDTVLVMLAAGNRDPSLNETPDRFQLDRGRRRSLGFGSGRHACPGEALACTLAAAGLELLLAQGVDVRAQAARGWRYRASVNTRIPTFD